MLRARARATQPIGPGPANRPATPKLQLHTFDSLNVVQVKSHAIHIITATAVEDAERAFPNRSHFDAILSAVVLS